MTNNLATSWCPYCLQQKPNITSATPSSRNVWVGDLDAEIERIENLISSLPLERSRLCRKRNEMRSPIYSLPPEILALIFKLACPPLDFLRKYGLNRSRPPIQTLYPRIIDAFSAVSAHWHNVVLSTPSLWASFIADDRSINAMQAIFARSGRLPVAASLNFAFSSSRKSRRTSMLAPILQENASRIRMLRVRGASASWLKEHMPSFVDLNLLCLVGNAYQDRSVTFDTSSRRPILEKFPCRISLAWSKIEVLHLSHVPVDVCLELLEKCTHLIEYRVEAPAVAGSATQLPSSPFTLPRLKLFEWPVYDKHSVDRAILKYIRMPALRTLVWVEQSSTSTESGLLSAFFEHLPSTLSTVEIQDRHTFSDTSVFSYLLNLSNAESLVSRRCTGSFMDGVFSKLGSEMCLVGNQVMSVLPKLRSIYIDWLFDNLDQTKVLQALRCRSSRPSESLPGIPFRLEFAKHQVNWTPECKEELIRMVEKGYKVELWEDSEPVDWLPR